MPRFRTELDVSTGESKAIQLTPSEEAEADALDALGAEDKVAVEAEQLRARAIKLNARRQALVAAIKGADDAQLLAYVQNHTTDNASTRQLIGDLVLLVAGVIRD